MMLTVRRVRPGDEPRWRELWDGYTRFYQREPSEEQTRYTWRRILDDAAPVYSIVAETADRGVIGIANYLVHENTSKLAPVCYLQDLFVDPACRGGGVGRSLIDWLVAETARQNWARLYWHTRENNYRARMLYDSYIPQRGSVCYVLENPAA